MNAVMMTLLLEASLLVFDCLETSPEPCGSVSTRDRQIDLEG